MKRISIVLAVLILTFGVACKSEIDNQPAAEVTEASATMATGTDPAPGAVVGKVIRDQSAINWVGAKVTRDHDGKFNNFDGWIEYQGAQPSRIAFEIDLSSIESDTEKLTGHLKSADFFDVAKFPKATFVSTSLAPAPAGTEPAGTTHVLRGTLNLHGVEKEVTVPVTTQVSPEGVRATSQFTINRHDWGISYAGAADDLIKDNVLIKLDMLFPPPPAA